MATGARAGRTLVVAGVLLLAVALAVAAFVLFGERRAGTEEPGQLRGSGESAATEEGTADDPEAEDLGAPAEGGPVVTRGNGQAGMGGLEVRVAPSGARVVVIGPDRFVHASTQFGTANLGSLPPGDYVLSGTMDGYAAANQDVRVEPGEHVSVSLDLGQPGIR